MVTNRTQKYFMVLIISSVIMVLWYSSHDGFIQGWPWTHYTGSYIGYFDIPEPRVSGVDCRGLFLGKENGTRYVNMTSELWNLPDEHYINAASDCPSFIKMRKYIMKPINAEEASFPLAFSLLVYKDVCQVEQLLRAIYRPQNYYCIHVDARAKPAVYHALSYISRCFENVVLSSQRFSVLWGEYSVLQPEFACMDNLWNYTDWKYFINLTGQEFPLKTILDIVQILKAFNGSNAIGINFGHYASQVLRVQYHYHHHKRTAKLKEPAPYNMTLMMGSLHVALTRSFVKFVLHHKIAQDFKQWVSDTWIPDETFFASLHVNPKLGVPGAYTGDILQPPWNKTDPFTRYKRWRHECRPGGLVCRKICILGVDDLVDLQNTQYMFANKFFSWHQPAGRMCLEELIFNRTREQTKGGLQLHLGTYKDRLFVKQHAPS